MQEFESLVVSLGSDISEFKKGFKEAQSLSADLNRDINNTGRQISEVGAKMAASSAIMIAGISAVNGSFDKQTQALAKVIGGIQGTTLVTGQLMQSYSKTSEAMRNYQSVQQQVIAGTASSKQGFLALTGALSSTVSMMGTAFTVGYALGQMLDKLTGISSSLGNVFYKVFMYDPQLEEELRRPSEVWEQLVAKRKHLSSEEAEWHKKMAERTAQIIALVGDAWANAYRRADVGAYAQQLIDAYEAERRRRIQGEIDYTDWYRLELEKRTKALYAEHEKWKAEWVKLQKERGLLHLMTDEAIKRYTENHFQLQLEAMEKALAEESVARKEAAEAHKRLIDQETKYVKESLSKEIAAYKEAAQEKVAAIRAAFDEIRRLESELANLASKRVGMKDSLEDARFGVKQKGRSPEDAYYAEQDRAYELLKKAEEASAAGQHELAQRYTEKAMAMFESLAREVQDAEGNIVVTLNQGISYAEAGLRAVEETYAEITAAEEKGLKAQIERQKQLISELKAELESLFEDMSRTITIKLDTTEAKEALAELKAQLNDFMSQMRGEISKAAGQSTPPEQHAYGGWVGGSRVGDSVPAMLSPGEYVVNAQAARSYAPMLEAINGFSLPSQTPAGNVSVNINVSQALTSEYIRDVLAPEIHRSISRSRIRSFK